MAAAPLYSPSVADLHLDGFDPYNNGYYGSNPTSGYYDPDVVFIEPPSPCTRQGGVICPGAPYASDFPRSSYTTPHYTQAASHNSFKPIVGSVVGIVVLLLVAMLVWHRLQKKIVAQGARQRNELQQRLVVPAPTRVVVQAVAPTPAAAPSAAAAAAPPSPRGTGLPPHVLLRFGTYKFSSPNKAEDKAAEDEGAQTADVLIMVADKPDPTCQICLDAYEDGDHMLALPCAHPFHKKCIVAWLKEQTTCPVCRISLLQWEDPEHE